MSGKKYVFNAGGKKSQISKGFLFPFENDLYYLIKTLTAYN